MKRKGLAAGVILAGLAGLGALWAGHTPPEGLTVIGDRTPAIRAALGLGRAPDPARPGSAPPPALTIVSVEDWSRMVYIEDIGALCGAACTEPAAAVDLTLLHPEGSRRVLVVNLAALPRQGEAPDLSCIGALLAAGLEPPPCLSGPVLHRRILPWGLGQV